MEEGSLNGHMVSNMMDNGKIIREMEEGSLNGQMILSMMENGKMMREMEEVLKNGQMVTNMKDIGRVKKIKVKESRNMLVEKRQYVSMKEES